MVKVKLSKRPEVVVRRKDELKVIWAETGLESQRRRYVAIVFRITK